MRALGVAHGMGIAHRDIKPANLFLVEVAGKRTIKVLDFGIAKVLAESDSVTRAFEETGGTVQAFTARYGAPEQFSRRFGATGPWTDVFALALVLVEVVLGTPALDGHRRRAAVRRRLRQADSPHPARPRLRPGRRGRGRAGDGAVGRSARALPERQRVLGRADLRGQERAGAAEHSPAQGRRLTPHARDQRRLVAGRPRRSR